MCNQAYDCRNFMKQNEYVVNILRKNTKCINEQDCFTPQGIDNKYFELIN